MSIEDDIKVILTCKNDLRCPHEASCCRVAEHLSKLLEKQKHKTEEPPPCAIGWEIIPIGQEALSADFEAVLDGNLWDLYED